MNSRAAWKNEESTYLLSPFNATIRGSYKNLLPKGRKVDHSNHCNFQIYCWMLVIDLLLNVDNLDCFPALQMHTDWVRDVAWAPNLGNGNR
ncbi:hypothetical protein HN51_030399 [Arachis hypogaea]